MSIDQYLSDNRERHLEELKALLRIPSVSTDPRHKGDVAACAEFVAERMREAGLTAEVHATQGHPIVYGEWLEAGPDAPTILIYGHYDVQPPDPLDEWRNPPFEPTIEGGNIVARGATDDKGQMYCHVKAIESHMRTAGRLPLNVKVLIEGEEEVGSESLEPFLLANQDRLRADAVIISDSPMFAPGRPSITVGLRGLSYIEVEVTGPSHDLHSGLYGGAVANPINALSAIIARLHDSDRRVTVPGFYDDVRALSDVERAEFAALDHDEAGFCKEIGTAAPYGEAGFTVVEQTTARPTLDCNGIWGGYIAEGAKTVLPSKAYAKISCRLVPDQSPADVQAKLIAHIESMGDEFGVTVKCSGHHGAQPFLADRDGAAIGAAMRAQSRVWGTDAVFTRGGGSIPIVASIKSILGIDSVLMGLGLEDDRLHSPNEKFALENYFQGIRSCAYFLEELAKG